VLNLDVLQALAEKYSLATVDFDTLKEHGLASRNDLVGENP
jgi:large subunit ribosomal protein L15